MTDYTINDLRDDIANTIRDLRNPGSGMTVDKAKAIGDLAQTMINSAKVEVEALKVVGRGRMKPTGFIATDHEDTLEEPDNGQARLPAPRQEVPTPKPHVYRAVGTAPRGAL